MATLLLLSAGGAWERLGLSFFYVTLSLLALLILSLSFLFGGHDEADHDVDHDVDHDGDTDHDADHDTGGAQGNLSLLSTKVFLGGAFGFGFGGFVGARIGLDWTGCNLCGVVGAIIFGALIYGLMNALYHRQGNSTVRMATLVGKTAIVDIAIGANSVGRIALELRSGTEIFRARSVDGSAIQSGSPVVITSVAGGETIVQKAV